MKGEYRGVLLDFGDTLYYSQPCVEVVVQTILGRHGYNVELREVHRAIREADKHHREVIIPRLLEGPLPLDLGSWRDLWSDHNTRIVESLGIRDSRLPLQIHDEWNSVPRQTRPFDEVPETLRQIRMRGHAIGLISNTDEDLRPFLARDGLLPLFDVVLLSFEVGRIKPDPEIFLEAARRLKLRPQDCVHVGDDVTYDVEGARAVGMTPVLIQRRGLTEGSGLDVTVISRLNELLNFI